MPKIKIREKEYFFVDESGDPTFYDRKGNYIVGKAKDLNVKEYYLKTDYTPSQIAELIKQNL